MEFLFAPPTFMAKVRQCARVNKCETDDDVDDGEMVGQPTIEFLCATWGFLTLRAYLLLGYMRG
jgi:hypothetical protein